MQITVIDVGPLVTHPTSKGGTYQSVEVTYKNDQGKTQSKKIVSFANPSVFKAIQTWNRGEVVDVISQKDDSGFFQWTGIGDGSTAQPTASGATPSKPYAAATRETNDRFETKDERQARQVLIVRQSTLSNAIALLTTGAKSPPSLEEVYKLAGQLQDYVFEKASAPTITYDPNNPADIVDHIPV